MMKKYLRYMTKSVNTGQLLRKTVCSIVEVTSPTVNQMINTLENKGLIRKKAKTARSISVLVPDELIPALE